MTLNYFENNFKKFREFILKNNITQKNFDGIIAGKEYIEEEDLDRYVNKHNLPQLKNLLSVWNGKIESKEFKDLINDTKVEDFIDRMQRRRRIYLPKWKSVSSQRQKNDYESADKNNSNIKGVIQKLVTEWENKMVGKYKIFKKLDIDNDGFISKDDFLQALDKEFKIHGSDGNQLFAHFDKQNKGFLNYNDVFNNGEWEGQAPGNMINSVVPDREYLQKVSNSVERTTNMAHLMKSIGKTPTFKLIYKPMGSTRSSSNPKYLWKDTFKRVLAVNHSQREESNAKNFNKSISNKLEFQAEDRQRKADHLKYKRAKMDQYIQMIDAKVEREDTKNFYSSVRANILRQKKTISDEDYETRLKLRNF